MGSESVAFRCKVCIRAFSSVTSAFSGQQFGSGLGRREGSFRKCRATGGIAQDVRLRVSDGALSDISLHPVGSPTLPAKDHCISTRISIHQCVCCLSLMPRSPSASLKKRLRIKSSARSVNSQNVGFLLQVMTNPQTGATRHLILRPFLDPRSAEQSQQSSSVVRRDAGHLFHCGIVCLDPCACSSKATSPHAFQFCCLCKLENWSWADGLSRRLWGVAIRKPPGLSAQNLTLTVIFRRRVVLPLVKKTPQSTPTPIPPRKKTQHVAAWPGRSPVTLPKSGPKRAVALAQTVTHLKQLEVLVGLVVE